LVVVPDAPQARSAAVAGWDGLPQAAAEPASVPPLAAPVDSPVWSPAAAQLAPEAALDGCFAAQWAAGEAAVPEIYSAPAELLALPSGSRPVRPDDFPALPVDAHQASPLLWLAGPVAPA
jgi:hypothetical protein